MKSCIKIVSSWPKFGKAKTILNAWRSMDYAVRNRRVIVYAVVAPVIMLHNIDFADIRVTMDAAVGLACKIATIRPKCLMCAAEAGGQAAPCFSIAITGKPLLRSDAATEELFFIDAPI